MSSFPHDSADGNLGHAGLRLITSRGTLVEPAWSSHDDVIVLADLTALISA